MIYAKGSGEKVGRYFQSREFDCPCDECDFTLIRDDLAEKLDALREYTGKPVQITSGYRCRAYQLDLARRGYETAKGTSTHEMGMAADVVCSGMTGPELERLAEKAGFEAVGVGRKFIHVDVRIGKRRRWGYVRA